MKLKTFLPVAATLSFLFGVLFYLVPVQTMGGSGVTLDVSGQSLARYLGSAYLGIGVMIWYARNSQANNEALRAIFLGGFCLSLTSAVIALMDAFGGVGNAFNWTTVILHLLLAVGFAYFRFGKSKGS